MADLIRAEFEKLIHGEMDSASCRRAIGLLTERFPEIRRQTVGYSVLRQPIELLTVGKGERGCLYVGAHHAMETITTSVLLELAWETALSGYCRYRYEILPMLNPDGADLRIHGPGADILCGRDERIGALLAMQPDGDFSRWQANIRGVDLNHNYDAGFADYRRVEKEQGIRPGATKYAGECPESEPESRALAGWIRRHRAGIPGEITSEISGEITSEISGEITSEISGGITSEISGEITAVISEVITSVITLHSQGREIYYSSGGTVLPGCRGAAERLSAMTGYSLSVPTGTAAYGGLTDWLIGEMAIPSFTLECGWGQNPLPVADLDGILAELLDALIVAPGLF